MITGKLPEFAGVLLEIQTLSTRFRMFDGVYVRLPNIDVFLSEIRNFSRTVARRIEFIVAIALRDNTSNAIKTIMERLNEIPLVLVEPEPQVYVENVAESSVNITIRCWVPSSQWFPLKKELVEVVKQELDKNGIEIPFPRRTFHLDKRTETVMRNKSKE